MPRPRLRRRRPTKKPRVLSPLQKVVVAREILAGRPQKQIAADWRISRSYVHRILATHLRVRYEWQPGMEPPCVVHKFKGEMTQ